MGALCLRSKNREVDLRSVDGSHEFPAGGLRGPRSRADDDVSVGSAHTASLIERQGDPLSCTAAFVEQEEDDRAPETPPMPRQRQQTT